MIIKDIILYISNLLKAKMLHQRIPFIVSWALTYRCNSKCLYCQLWNSASKELDTKEILSILDELVTMGMRWISFTGGEPLLREDIGEIIDHVSKMSTKISINSNGILVNEKISQIRNIDRISLSFDGPKHVHDLLRGRGSHDKVIEAIRIARSNNIQTVLNTVLSKYNLDHVDYILKIAEQFGIKVLFQPATTFILGGNTINPVAPLEEECKKVIAKLITKKKIKDRSILNSISGLRYIYHWPNPKNISCSGGKLYFRIEPNGLINTCSRLFLSKCENSQDALKLGVKEAICKIVPTSCNFCWCSNMVEFNLAASFDILAITNILDKLKF